jgi:hypothetical protein
MLKIFFFTLIILATIAGGSQVLISNMLQATMIVENNATVSGTMNRLKQSVLFVGGQYYLPYGIEKSDYHALPANFFGLRKSAQGRDIIYCPYAMNPPGATTSTVTMAGGDTYNVQLDSSFSPDGADYIVGSDAPPVPGIAAAIILPQRSADVPSCDDVQVNTEGEYVLGGDSLGKGLLYVLTQSEIAFVHRGGINEFIESSEPANELENVLSEVSLKPSENAVITLEAGEAFSMSSGFTFTSTDSTLPRSIIIQSSQPGVAAQINTISVVGLDFSGTNITLKDVTFGSNVRVSVTDGEAVLSNVSAPTLRADYSEIIVQNVGLGRNGVSTASLDLRASKLIQKGALAIQGNFSVIASIVNSEWLVRGDLTISYVGNPVALQFQDSEMDARGVTINSTGVASTLFYLDTASRLQMDSVIWNNSGNLNYGFYTLGKMSIIDSALNGSNQVGVGISSIDGSVTRIEGTTIGSSASPIATAWEALPSSRLSGEADVYAVDCAAGDMFLDNSISGQPVAIFLSDRFVMGDAPGFFGAKIYNNSPGSGYAPTQPFSTLILTCN